jgi:hypothetical protein
MQGVSIFAPGIAACVFSSMTKTEKLWYVDSAGLLQPPSSKTKTSIFNCTCRMALTHSSPTAASP